MNGQLQPLEEPCMNSRAQLRGGKYVSTQEVTPHIKKDKYSEVPHKVQKYIYKPLHFKTLLIYCKDMHGSTYHRQEMKEHAHQFLAQTRRKHMHMTRAERQNSNNTKTSISNPILNSKWEIKSVFCVHYMPYRHLYEPYLSLYIDTSH